jgi:DNA primase
MKNQNLSANHIKGTINPLGFYRHELPDAPLKKQGWNDGGLCPFHSDSNKGSFRVNTDTGAFKCYSCGTKGGDVIAFTMALHGLSIHTHWETIETGKAKHRVGKWVLLGGGKP